MLISSAISKHHLITPFVFEEDYLSDGVDDMVKSTLSPIEGGEKFSPIALRKDCLYLSVKNDKRIMVKENLHVSFIDDRKNIVSKHFIHIKKPSQKTLSHLHMMTSLGSESVFLHSKILDGLGGMIKDNEDYSMYYLHGALLFCKNDITKTDLGINSSANTPHLAAICVMPIETVNKSAHDIMKLQAQRQSYIENAWRFFLHLQGACQDASGRYPFLDTSYFFKPPTL